jgi:hypothetical protein
MLSKKLFLGALLLTVTIIVTGCETTADYKDDPARRYRIASDECRRFGHVTGSDGFNSCMDKRLGTGIEIASATEHTKQTSFKIPPPPSLAELLGSDVNETDQGSAKYVWEDGVTELMRIPTLPVTPQEPLKVEGLNSDDYTLKCRDRVFTGSRIKHRVCAPIAEWAAFDRKNREDTEQLYRDVDRVSSENTGSDTDPFGGSTAGRSPRF